MRIPAAGLAFIQLQTAPGPEAPFVHVMCLPTSPSCMQNFSIKEMRTLLMFPATLPFHFPVHDTAVQPHRLLSSDGIRGQKFPWKIRNQHRQMMQPMMRSVPPHQVMPDPCPPGPHLKDSHNI